jgi:hypothetical protein
VLFLGAFNTDEVHYSLINAIHMPYYSFQNWQAWTGQDENRILFQKMLMWMSYRMLNALRRLEHFEHVRSKFARVTYVPRLGETNGTQTSHQLQYSDFRHFIPLRAQPERAGHVCYNVCLPSSYQPRGRMLQALAAFGAPLSSGKKNLIYTA